MKVSVITICLNPGKKIRKTIESVIHQTYTNIEYIIIDGLSHDNSLDIVKEYTKFGICLYSEVDYGISSAFNKGFQKSSGDSIIYLNAGDYFVSNRVVEEYVRDYKMYNVDILSYKVHIDRDEYIPSNKYKDNEDKIWQLSIMPHQGTFVIREVFYRIGLFDCDLRIRMDYGFFCRARINDISFKYIPKVIVEYEPGGISMKRSNRYTYLLEEIRINRFLGIINNPIIYTRLIKRFIEKLI